MRIIFKYIAFGIALLASSFVLNAQGTYHREGGMATSKKVTGPENGYYTISLESFATGETTVTETATPVDIVLVLDVSGSMADPLYKYTATDQAWSYNTVGSTQRYYLHEDGRYYPVSREGSNNSRRLEFTVGANQWGYGGTTWYLTGTGATTTRPAGVRNDATIYTGPLATRSNEGTKLANLKSAVRTFVNTVNHNANYDSKEQERDEIVHNQISVVKYAYNIYVNANGQTGNYTSTDPENASGHDVITPGNYVGSGYGNSWNPTQVLVGFTDVSTTDGVNRVIGEGNYEGVNDLSAGGATAADFGMTKAWYLLNQPEIKNRESNKVVVLFTDGEPTYGNEFDSTVAGNTIAAAKKLKDDFNATVFTIGVFDNVTDDIRDYMNWTSSNYPNATGWNAGGAGSDKGFYQNASGANLAEIFKAVASASAAADATAGASTQVRDVISNSFIMPDVEDADITFKVAEIKPDNSGWKDAVDAEGVTYVVKTVTTTTGEEHKELVVQGFDYTKADVIDPNTHFTVTPGNWVGERYSNATTKYWAGKKLIISFKIKANEEATGGDGTATNHPDSGVYVQELDKDGKPVLDENGQPKYNKVNQYDVPHTPLPLLIRISKSGLRKGESATFQLMRIRPLGWNDEGATLEEKMANVQYNAIGKPKPGTHEFDPVKYDREGNPTDERLDPDDPMDYLEGIGWEDWSKVILTNKTADKTAVIKSLYGLDPGWVYMIVEDDWAWSYQLTGSASSETTSSVEVNPFSFENTPRTVNLNGDPIVKHAESVTINHFKTLEQGSTSREEHYKSSKTNFESR